MATRTVTNLTAVLQMNNTKFKQGLTGSQKALKGFQSQIKAIGGMIAGAFAVTSLINFGKEAVTVAMKAEGIRTAFERLNEPGLLDNLKQATRETVSEIELMQAAVRAKNFKIPLEQLGTFFQFATDRAIQTGESVDYLVNSIIDGIGRKSTLVLDNLGISATELQEEMKLVGDFGKAAANIISREMEAAGEVMSTTAIKAGQLRAKFQNITETVGGGLIDALTAASDAYNMKFNPEQWAADIAARDLNEALTEQTKHLQNIADLDTRMGNLKGLKNKMREEREEYNRLMKTVKTPDALNLPEGFDQYFSQAGTKFMPDYPGDMYAGSRAGSSPIQGRTLDELNAMNTLMEDMDQWLEELEEDMDDALGEETFRKVSKVSVEMKKMGQLVGVVLVGQFDNLGMAIGRAIGGAEMSIKSLAQSIIDNVGSILLMAGLESGNVALMIAGGAAIIGSGIWKGIDSAKASTNQETGPAYSHNVQFQIDGNNLVGVMENTNRRNSYIG